MDADGTDWDKEADTWQKRQHADQADQADTAKPARPADAAAADRTSTAESTGQPGDAPGRRNRDAASGPRPAENARQPPDESPAPGQETRSLSTPREAAAAARGQWMPELAGHRPDRASPRDRDRGPGSDRSPDQAPDQRPDRGRRHWYDPLDAQMASIEKKRPTTPDAEGNVIDPETWRRQWYRERFRVDDRHVPAPFDLDKARLVPDLAGSRDRPRGLLVIHPADHHAGADIPLLTAYDGAMVRELRARLGGRELSELGFHPHVVSHPEANMAMRLRLETSKAGYPVQATAYVNRMPCELRRDRTDDGPRRLGCADLLQTQLPEGCKVTIYGPGGYTRTFHGNPDRPPKRTR